MNKSESKVLRLLLSLMLLICGGNSYAIDKADSVLVDKSDARLYLIRDGVPFRECHVAFGANPKDHEQEEDGS